MTRFPGLDPEILADLRAREQSVDDRARHRRVRNPWADAARVVFVEHWPCAKGCGAMVGITQEAVTALTILNGQLAVERQRPIAKAQAVPCEVCKRADDAAEQARRRPHEQRTIAGLEPGGKGRP
jgi:hypothetical protein